MIQLYLIFSIVFLYTSPTLANGGCHPQCSWQCDDPVCAASCQINCATSCPTTPCGDRDCHCSSFDDPEISNCTPPTSAPCTSCQLEQRGNECKNSKQEPCSCDLLCTQECTWDCQTPNCKQPQCELQCEQPACDVSVVFP